MLKKLHAITVLKQNRYISSLLFLLTLCGLLAVFLTIAVPKQYACIPNPGGGCAFFGCNGTNSCSVWTSGPKFIDSQCSHLCQSVTPSPIPSPSNSPEHYSPPQPNSLDTMVGGIAISAFNSAALSSYNNNNPELQVWSYSSCSGCSIASVINALGGATIGNHAGKPIVGETLNLNCGDVLEYENSINAWSTSAGLLSWGSITKTAANFGFNASLGYPGQTTKSFTDIVNIANGGQPVVIGLRDHILVVSGGDSQNVFLVDSSLHNFQSASYDAILRTGLTNSNEYWDGSYAILTRQ